MRRNNQSQQNTGDGFQTGVVIILFVGVMAAAAWWKFGVQIKWYFVLACREMLIPPLWVAPMLSNHYISEFNGAARYLASGNGTRLSFGDAHILLSFIASTYYYLFALPTAYIVYKLWRRPVALNYTGKMTLSTLVQRNSKLYPQIRPAFMHDLLSEDVDSGVFARPADYRGMAEKHKLLLDSRGRPTRWREWHSDIKDKTTYNQKPTGRPDEPRIPIPYPAPAMNRATSHALFSEQLGPLWEGVDELPPYHRALFGVIAARIVRDKDAADAAIFQMNASWSEKKNGKTKMVCRLGLKLAAKYQNDDWVSKVLKSHAYQATVFTALLQTAHDRSGTFPTSMFLWLKVVDRPLFFALNQVGRRVAWPEAAGVRAHLLAEKEQKRAITAPVVGPAMRAMAFHLMQEGYLHPDQNIAEPSARKPKRTKRKKSPRPPAKVNAARAQAGPTV